MSSDVSRRVMLFGRNVRGGGAGKRVPTSEVTKEGQNDGFDLLNAVLERREEKKMKKEEEIDEKRGKNAMSAFYEDEKEEEEEEEEVHEFLKCSACKKVNTGRVLNSKTIEDGKICFTCYWKELKATDHKVASGMLGGIKVPFSEYEKLQYKHYKETGHKVQSKALDWEVVFGEYMSLMQKHYIETGHKVQSKTLDGEVVFGEYDRSLKKHKKETGHMVQSKALDGEVVFGEYLSLMRKHYKETGHMVKSKTLGGYVEYGKIHAVKKQRILWEMQAHESRNGSCCANCNCQLSAEWCSLSDMESELKHLCELAGIKRSEEEVRAKLGRMFPTTVFEAMKNDEGVYLCLACKEKKFFKVRKICANIVREKSLANTKKLVRSSKRYCTMIENYLGPSHNKKRRRLHNLFI